MEYQQRNFTNKIIRTYLLITFAFMVPACALVLGFTVFNRPIYGSALEVMALAVGGLSTATAGAVTAKKYGKINSYRTLFKDFFQIKQPIIYYLALIGFLVALFSTRILQEQMQTGRSWANLPLLFFVAILFGGVEEIGWRYLFGPALESKFPFAVSSIIVAGLWAIWHIMFFIVDGSILMMQPQDIGIFVINLFGTSFVLGTIYRITKSLWLCVFYHALLNAFTQMFVPVSTIGTIVISIVCILLSLITVKLRGSQSDEKMKSEYE